MNMCLSKWHGQSNLKRPFSVLSPMLLLQEVTPEVLLDGRGLRQVQTSIFFFLQCIFSYPAGMSG